MAGSGGSSGASTPFRPFASAPNGVNGPGANYGVVHVGSTVFAVAVMKALRIINPNDCKSSLEGQSIPCSGPTNGDIRLYSPFADATAASKTSAYLFIDDL